MGFLVTLFRLAVKHVMEKDAEITFAKRVGSHMVGRMKAFGLSIGGKNNPVIVYRRLQRFFTHNEMKEAIGKITHNDPYQYVLERFRSWPLRAIKEAVGEDGYEMLTKLINRAKNVGRQQSLKTIMFRIKNNLPFIEGLDFGSSAIDEMKFTPTMSFEVDNVKDAAAIGTCDIRFKLQRKHGYYTYYNVSLELFINMLKRKGRGGTIMTPAGAWSYFMHNDQQYFAVKEHAGRDKAVIFNYKKQVKGGMATKKQLRTAHKLMPIKQIWITKNIKQRKQRIKRR